MEERHPLTKTPAVEAKNKLLMTPASEISELVCVLWDLASISPHNDCEIYAYGCVHKWFIPFLLQNNISLCKYTTIYSFSSSAVLVVRK